MLGIKLLLLAGVLAAGAVGGAIPLWRGRADGAGAARGLLDRGNAFAAGVFLGAGFLHMLPEAQEAWQSLGWHYPMAFLVAVAAFALLLLFEHVLLPDDAHHAVHAAADERFAPVGHGRHGLAAYAVLTALSLHSLVAGLALGTQADVGGALVIFLAILSHKTVEGFALGVSLVRDGMSRRRAWGLLAVFSAATPLGILVGTFLDETLEGPVQSALQAGFLALAAGTFVYVATLDILRDELHGPGPRWTKWLWIVAGIALMAALALRG